MKQISPAVTADAAAEVTDKPKSTLKRGAYIAVL